MSRQNSNAAIPDVLIVGLGNPGPDYARSRHNLGAEAVRTLAARLAAPVDRRRWNSLVGCAEPGPVEGPPADGGAGRKVWLILPQTYVNESGRAVRAALRDTGIPASSLWVVHDELDLPLCRLRVQQGGSAAGHNGLRSIMSATGGEGFARFRIGVGKPPSAAKGARYVLSAFGRREAPLAERVVGGTADALQLALASGLEAAMGIYNRAGSLGCEELS